MRFQLFVYLHGRTMAYQCTYNNHKFLLHDWSHREYVGTNDCDFGEKTTFENVIIRILENWKKNVQNADLNLLQFQATQFDSLPVFLFGGSAILAAVLVFFLPETYQKKLPDTVDEAKTLG